MKQVVVTKSDLYSKEANETIDYLEMRAAEPSERGRLARAIYSMVGTGKLSIEDVTVNLGAYNAGGIILDETLQEQGELITLLESVRAESVALREKKAQVEAEKEKLIDLRTKLQEHVDRERQSTKE